MVERPFGYSYLMTDILRIVYAFQISLRICLLKRKFGSVKEGCFGLFVWTWVERANIYRFGLATGLFKITADGVSSS